MINRRSVAMFRFLALVASVSAASKDWRTGSCLSGVVDSGGAAGRYAGVASATLDAIQCLSPGGSLTRLSLAQIVDCMDTMTENTTVALDYAKQNGLEGEADYPETGKRECRYDATKVRTRIASVVAGKGDASMATALQTSPVVAEIIVGDEWLEYTGGVLTNCGNSSALIVSVVGVDDSKWIVKGSFGSTWGMGGYAEVARNACGLGAVFAHAAL